MTPPTRHPTESQEQPMTSTDPLTAAGVDLAGIDPAQYGVSGQDRAELAAAVLRRQEEEAWLAGEIAAQRVNLTGQLARATGAVRTALDAYHAAARVQRQLTEYDAHRSDVDVLLTEAGDLLGGLNRAGTLLRAAYALHTSEHGGAQHVATEAVAR